MKGAREQGFTAAGPPFQHKDRIRAFRPKCVYEPGRDGGAVEGAEREQFRETVQSAHGRGGAVSRRQSGRRKGESGERLPAGVVEVLANAPAMSVDFEYVTLSVGQVKNTFRRRERIAFEPDPVIELLGWVLGMRGADFQGTQHGAKGILRRWSFIYGYEFADQPIAKIGRAERVDVPRPALTGDGGARLAVLGGEWRGRASSI